MWKEAQELRTAPVEARLEEAADVWEVLSALASAIGLSLDQFATAAEAKRQSRGGFDGKLWLERW